MAYTTKNYHDAGGDRWVVGGELAIQSPGSVTKDGQPIALGKLIPHLDPATATVADVINTLITNGYMSAS